MPSLSTILAGIAVALALACGVIGWRWSVALEGKATAEAALSMAVEVNKANTKIMLERETALARVQAQSIKLTEANRALTAAGVALQQNLSDAAKKCPVVADDLAAIQRLLDEGTADGGQGGAAVPGGAPR